MLRYVLIGLLFLIGKPVLSQCIDGEGEVYDYQLTGISIEGSTNINRFSFLYDDSPITSDPVETEYSNEEDSTVDFKIPLQSFDGSIPAMKSDFLELLKADEYPEVVVAIDRDRFNCGGELTAENVSLTVTLAGIRKAIPADFISYVNDEKLILSGSTKFLLSDFKLDPPQKALGLIHVRNEVFIKFDIVIEDLTNTGIQAKN